MAKPLITGFLIGDSDSVYKLLELADYQTKVGNDRVFSEIELLWDDLETKEIRSNHVIRLRYETVNWTGNTVSVYALLGPNPGGSGGPSIGRFKIRQVNGHLGAALELKNGWILFTNTPRTSKSVGPDTAGDWEPVVTENVVAMAEGTAGLVQVDGSRHTVFLYHKHGNKYHAVKVAASGSRQEPVKIEDEESWSQSTGGPPTPPSVPGRDTPQKSLLLHVDAVVAALDGRWR